MRPIVGSETHTHAPSCVHPSTQQILHRTSDIPASKCIRPESVEMSDDGYTSPGKGRRTAIALLSILSPARFSRRPTRRILRRFTPSITTSLSRFHLSFLPWLRPPDQILKCLMMSSLRHGASRVLLHSCSASACSSSATSRTRVTRTARFGSWLRALPRCETTFYGGVWKRENHGRKPQHHIHQLFS